VVVHNEVLSVVCREFKRLSRISYGKVMIHFSVADGRIVCCGTDVQETFLFNRGTPPAPEYTGGFPDTAIPMVLDRARQLGNGVLDFIVHIATGRPSWFEIVMKRPVFVGEETTDK